MFWWIICVDILLVAHNSWNICTYYLPKHRIRCIYWASHHRKQVGQRVTLNLEQKEVMIEFHNRQVNEGIPAQNKTASQQWKKDGWVCWRKTKLEADGVVTTKSEGRKAKDWQQILDSYRDSWPPYHSLKHLSVEIRCSLPNFSCYS